MEKNPSSSYKIRFTDCDLFSHLNNARFIDYFINAREDHIKEHYDIDLKTFFGNGISWLVGSHEIIYKKPAQYNEIVTISSMLLRAGPDSLLVEMVMTDKEDTHVKSILWTTFIPIDVKTGRKQEHPASFMEFARSVENIDIDISEGIKGRELFFRSAKSQKKALG